MTKKLKKYLAGIKNILCESKTRTLIFAAAFAVSAVLLLLRFGLSWLFVRNLLFTLVLIFVGYSDFKEKKIPNPALISGLVIWAAALPLTGQANIKALYAIITGAAFAGGLFLLKFIFEIYFKKVLLGSGDIKLIFVSALYLGLWHTVLMIFLSCIIELLVLLLKYKKFREVIFPFGPAICLSTFVMLFWD